VAPAVALRASGLSGLAGVDISSAIITAAFFDFSGARLLRLT
jgi:hypothetical protein